MSSTTIFEAERRGLTALAFRMLGTVADAEDAVQEAWVRWLRLSDDERGAIANPAAWLTRVTSRVCLDVLGSARSRHEEYVGEWLPEPVPSGSVLASPSPSDPLDQVTLDESVSTALLVVLESLTPAQRVVLVLHDVFGLPFAEVAEAVGRTPAACRQLAVAARRRVATARAGRAPRSEHDALVAAFGQACATGDLAGLTAVLAPDAVLRSDGGGKVSAARRPVHGADRVARFVLGLVDQNPGAVITPVETPDGGALLVTAAGVVEGLVGFGASDGAVTEVWIMRNPDKLTLWRADVDGSP